jgi:hypothetical protein
MTSGSNIKEIDFFLIFCVFRFQFRFWFRKTHFGSLTFCIDPVVSIRRIKFQNRRNKTDGHIDRCRQNKQTDKLGNKTNGQLDRQIDRQTDRQTNGETKNEQTNRQTGGETKRMNWHAKRWNKETDVQNFVFGVTECSAS